MNDIDLILSLNVRSGSRKRFLPTHTELNLNVVMLHIQRTLQKVLKGQKHKCWKVTVDLKMEGP